MKGIVFKGNKTLSVTDFPDPEPKAGEVIVKLKAAGICGSDLHLYHLPPEHLQSNVIVGHEPAGVVHKLGEGVDNLKVGDRVSVNHYLSCGHCRHCLAGNKMFCAEGGGLGWKANGADAEYLLVPAENCLPLPDKLSFIDGVFISCIAGTAWSALKKMNPSGKDTLAVFGLGPVGLTTILLAKAMGCRTIGIDSDIERLKLAKKIGTDKVVDFSKENCVESILNYTDGLGASKAIETSGSGIAQKNVVSAMAKQGDIVLIGLAKDALNPEARVEMSVNPTEIILKELKIMGTYVMAVSEYHNLVDFLIMNDVDFNQIVTHEFTIDQGIEAFEIFEKGGTGKVIFTYK